MEANHCPLTNARNKRNDQAFVSDISGDRVCFGNSNTTPLDWRHIRALVAYGDPRPTVPLGTAVTLSYLTIAVGPEELESFELVLSVERKNATCS